MFYLRNGDILPGTGIGILKLGMSFQEIKNIIGEFEVNDLEESWLLKAGDVYVWIWKKTDQATQIMVFGDFKGKYAGAIGIGSTLGDVKAKLKTNWHEELDVIVLDNVPGMCFTQTDEADDDWDEQNEPYEIFQLRATIGFICVYKHLPGQPRWDEASQAITYS